MRDHTITLENISQNPDKPWNWNALTKKPNITLEFFRQNLDKPWDWDYLTENSIIKWKILEQTPNKPWNWNELSKKFTNLINLPSVLSKLPNTTWEFILQNLDKPWDWKELSSNNFTLSREEFEKSQKCKAFADSIHEDLVKHYWHPKRLVKYGLKEFDE
jgi:hypothetical protein